jgi:hypothetical protein
MWVRVPPRALQPSRQGADDGRVRLGGRQGFERRLEVAMIERALAVLGTWEWIDAADEPAASSLW